MFVLDIHPDNAAIPSIKFVPANALVLGLQTVNLSWIFCVPSLNIE
jgi:hypothetical protein